MPLLHRVLAPIEDALYGAIAFVTGRGGGDDVEPGEDPLVA